MPGSSQDILAQNNINRFQLIHLLRYIVNVVWQWYIFQHQQHFPKKHFQFVEAGQRGRHHPSKVTMMLMVVIIMRIIHVDIGIVELIKFMKHLLDSLIHSGNLKFQPSFWANQALPKRKVRGIIQSSLSSVYALMIITPLISWCDQRLEKTSKLSYFCSWDRQSGKSHAP